MQGHPIITVVRSDGLFGYLRRYVFVNKKVAPKESALRVPSWLDSDERWQSTGVLVHITPGEEEEACGEKWGILKPDQMSDCDGTAPELQIVNADFGKKKADVSKSYLFYTWQRVWQDTALLCGGGNDDSSSSDEDM